MARMPSPDTGKVYGTWEILPQDGLTTLKRNIRCLSCQMVTTKYVNNLKYGNPPACPVCGRTTSTNAELKQAAKAVPQLVIHLDGEFFVTRYYNAQRDVASKLDVGICSRLLASSTWNAAYLSGNLDISRGDPMSAKWKNDLRAAIQVLFGQAADAPLPAFSTDDSTPSGSADALYSAGDVYRPALVQKDHKEPKPEHRALALDEHSAREANRVGYLPSTLPTLMAKGPTMVWPVGAKGVCLPRRGCGFFHPKQDAHNNWVHDPDTMDKAYVTPEAAEALEPNSFNRLIGLSQPMDAGNGWVHVYWQDVNLPEEADFDLDPNFVMPEFAPVQRLRDLKGTPIKPF